MARIAAIFSLASGAVIDLGICRYAGKGQSELGLLRLLMNIFRPGDIGAAEGAGLRVNDMILEVAGAPIGQFGPRQYVAWRQYNYDKDGVVELLVAFRDPASGQLRYFYPEVKLKERTP